MLLIANMSDRKLVLFCSLFLLCWPSSSLATSLLAEKRSELTCLFGQPGFSERLMQNNPWHTRKVTGLSDRVLGQLTAAIKPSRAIPIQHYPVSAPDNLFKTFDLMSSQLGSAISVNLLWEAGVYFHKGCALYLAGLGQPISYGLVLGDHKRFLGTHLSIGQFPIHFGSGLSEYPLAKPLEHLLGLVANKRAVSLNTGHRWDAMHKTKIRVFSFLNDNCLVTRDKKKTRSLIRDIICNHSGLNIEHHWMPSFCNVTVGLSTTSRLPFTVDKKKPKKSEVPAVNLYTHYSMGPCKLRVEGLAANTVETKPKSNQKASADTQKSILNYVGRAEFTYQLPTQQNNTVVIGYNRIEACDFSKRMKRVLVGFKSKVSDNIQYIVGIQRELGKLDVFTPSDENLSWEHSLHLQLNLTL